MKKLFILSFFNVLLASSSKADTFHWYSQCFDIDENTVGFPVTYSSTTIPESMIPVKLSLSKQCEVMYQAEADLDTLARATEEDLRPIGKITRAKFKRVEDAGHYTQISGWACVPGKFGQVDVQVVMAQRLRSQAIINEGRLVADQPSQADGGQLVKDVSQACGSSVFEGDVTYHFFHINTDKVSEGTPLKLEVHYNGKWYVMGQKEFDDTLPEGFTVSPFITVVE